MEEDKMAYGDIGMFLPSEEAYTKPGSYENALQAEATKRASYLSSMDQFYAGLDAAMERLELEISSREKMFSEELAWQKEFGTRQLDIERLKASAAYRGTSGGGTGGQQELDWLTKMLGGTKSTGTQAYTNQFLPQTAQAAQPSTYEGMYENLSPGYESFYTGLGESGAGSGEVSYEDLYADVEAPF